MAQREIVAGRKKRFHRVNNFFRFLRRELLQFCEYARETLTGSGPVNADLTILDDYFPNPQTGFRVAEYHYLYDHLSSVSIYSTAGINKYKKYRFLRWFYSFSDLIEVYASFYPDRVEKVYKFNRYRPLKTKLAYIHFVTNAFNFLDYLEKFNTKFIFTLYPGGGFFIGDSGCDDKLKQIFNSPCFAGVIVTQPLSRDYLITKNFCPESRIHEIFGVVVDSERYRKNQPRIPADNVINICFVAFKYMDQGKDKGYDIFIETCHNLKSSDNRYCFHVVGNFGPLDIDVAGIEGSIHFNGPLVGDKLLNFYADMDIIIAPNRAFALHPGAFDGFPTGCCVEAALCGVAVFCTDPLLQNRPFIDGEHLVLIDTDPVAIATKIHAYASDPEKLLRLKQLGRKRFWEVYAIDRQMQPRLDIIKAAMAGAA